jgi:hypothetical protein
MPRPDNATARQQKRRTAAGSRTAKSTARAAEPAVSSIATARAKPLRDLTEARTSAARKALR